MEFQHRGGALPAVELERFHRNSLSRNTGQELACRDHGAELRQLNTGQHSCNHQYKYADVHPETHADVNQNTHADVYVYIHAYIHKDGNANIHGHKYKRTVYCYIYQDLDRKSVV